MKLLTLDAGVFCQHQGRVKLDACQRFVTIAGRPVLVATDPEGKSIVGCPMVPPMAKTCVTTFPVATGYSSFVRIDGRKICLDTVTGLTDGVPPVQYTVQAPGQSLVSEVA
jgi:hypothetical protein